ncbi:protein-cysteine N-palmitoyltransferase HHAT-like [Haemaphysalis longicornis]
MSPGRQVLNWSACNSLRIAHWTCWIGILLYAFYRVFEKKAEIISAMSQEAEGFCEVYDCNERDFGDIEWDGIVNIAWSARYWFLGHLVAAQLIAKFQPQLLQCFYAGYSVLFMGLHFPAVVWLRIGIMLLALWASVQLRRKAVVYAAGAAMVAYTTINIPFVPHYPIPPCLINGSLSFEAAVFFTGWNVLRCVSVAADLIDANREGRTRPSRSMFLRELAYLLYFPSLMTGPITNCADFMKEPFRPPLWSAKRLLEFLVRSGRLALGFLLTEGFVRLAYVRGAALCPQWLLSQSGWPLAGIVYFTTVHFYLKYNFCYGLSSLFFWLDGVYERHDLRPRCSLRISTASNTWRYFDIGLYRWILRYIYKPVVSHRWNMWRRFLGTCASFSFVLIWHSVRPNMLVWAGLNFLLVLAEMACTSVINSVPWAYWRALYLSPPTEQVLRGVLCALSLVGVIASSFFYLTDVTIARGSLAKLLAFPVPLLPVLLGLYCKAQVAMDVLEWEKTSQGTKANDGVQGPEGARVCIENRVVASSE